METYYGFVRTPLDAVILFEACRLGILPRVQRRLSEKERHNIRSGSVFVWDEREAGMRRWTDGKSWSASRVSGSFLTYREMVGKTSTTSNSNTTNDYDNDTSTNDDNVNEGYVYKPDGLMKQSFSITTSTNLKLHLISYFSRMHANSNELPIPSQDSNLKSIIIPKGLYPDSSSSTSATAEHHNRPMRSVHPHPSHQHQYMSSPPPPPPPPHPHSHYQYHQRNPYMAPPAQVMHPLQPPPPAQQPQQQPPVYQSPIVPHPNNHHQQQHNQPHQSVAAPPPQNHHHHHHHRHPYAYQSPPSPVHSTGNPQLSSTIVQQPTPPSLPPPNTVTTPPDTSSTQLNAQDIPYEKVHFGEDQRAIQVLDRRFIL